MGARLATNGEVMLYKICVSYSTVTQIKELHMSLIPSPVGLRSCAKGLNSECYYDLDPLPTSYIEVKCFTQASMSEHLIGLPFLRLLPLMTTIVDRYSLVLHFLGDKILPVCAQLIDSLFASFHSLRNDVDVSPHLPMVPRVAWTMPSAST